MRPAHPVQRFVALLPLVPACRPPSTTFRGPIGSSTEGFSAPVRMRPRSPMWHFHPPSAAFRGPIKGAPPKAPVPPSVCVWEV
eukprot:2223271-Pyramimonas_sp.AAC.1